MSAPADIFSERATGESRNRLPLRAPDATHPSMQSAYRTNTPLVSLPYARHSDSVS
jgi:hypothetical protein